MKDVIKIIYFVLLGAAQIISSTLPTTTSEKPKKLPLNVVYEKFHGTTLNSSSMHLSSDEITFTVLSLDPAYTISDLRISISTSLTVSPITGQYVVPIIEQNTIKVPLPPNIDGFSLKWLAVSLDSNKTFMDFCWLGNVPLQVKVPPQTFSFNNNIDFIKSGPVVIVDKDTLFIPNFSYKKLQDSNEDFFCTGTDNTSGTIFVRDLSDVKNVNLYVNVPNNNNVDYFGVCSKRNNDGDTKVLAKVSLKVGEVPDVIANRKIMDLTLRVPKCCSISNVFTKNGNCVGGSVSDFRPDISIFDHNATHLNTEPLQVEDFEFVPYYSNIKCDKIPLAKGDDFGLLKNGSLILKMTSGLGGVLSQGEFCIEIMENYTFVTFICIPEEKINFAIFQAYLFLEIISLICLVVACIIYQFCYKYENIHKRCFAFYAMCMCVAIFCQILIQSKIDNPTGCIVIGFLYQIAMTASFGWLAILCLDMLLLVVWFEENTKRGKRIYYFIGMVVGLTVISLIVSLSRNLVPDVPNSFFKLQYKQNSCEFEEEDQRSIYFFAPILFCIVLGLTFLCLTLYHIIEIDKTKNNNYFWVTKREKFRFLFNGYVILFVTNCFGVLCYFMAGNSGKPGIYDFIDVSKGVVTLLVFIWTKGTLDAIKSRFKRFFAIRNKNVNMIIYPDDRLLKINKLESQIN